MNQYHKIQSIYKRNINGDMLYGEYSMPEFEYLAMNQWVFSEKVDGTNVRVIYADDKLTFKGKTDRAVLPDRLLKRLEEMFGIDQFKEFSEGVCLYGEGFGMKIQKGHKYIPDNVSFALFDIKIGSCWLRRETVNELGKQFNIDVVPEIGRGTLPELVALLEKTKLKSKWGDCIIEGIVARPIVELNNRFNRRVITKFKYRDIKV